MTNTESAPALKPFREDIIEKAINQLLEAEAPRGAHVWEQGWNDGVQAAINLLSCLGRADREFREVADTREENARLRDATIEECAKFLERLSDHSNESPALGAKLSAPVFKVAADAIRSLRRAGEKE